MKILNFIIIFLIPAFLSAQTVKNNANSVYLLESPSNNTTKHVGELKRFEEAEILSTGYLKDEKWYRVRASKHVGWQKNYIEGWVPARLFSPIDQASEADICTDCDNKADSSLKDIQDISAVLATKEKFVWPVSGVLRSGFGMRRHPIKKIVKLHNGIDISGNNERPIVAAKSGTVTNSTSGCVTGDRSCNNGAGNFVVIDHGDGTMTKYLHLNPKCDLAILGQIKQGDVLGCVGATGGATGPHLHFIVLINGKPVNPLLHLPKRASK